MAIKDALIFETGDGKVIVDIFYDSEHRYYEGDSRVIIQTRGNGKIDSVTINELDKDGNLISSQGWYD